MYLVKTFYLTKYRNSVTALFSDTESYEPKKNVKLEKVYFFVLISSISQRQNCFGHFLIAADSSCQIQYALNFENLLQKLQFTLTILPDYFSANFQEIILVLVFSASCKPWILHTTLPGRRGKKIISSPRRLLASFLFVETLNIEQYF